MNVDDEWITTETISDWPQGKIGKVMAWVFVVGLCSLPVLGGLIVAALLVVK